MVSFGLLEVTKPELVSMHPESELTFKLEGR